MSANRGFVYIGDHKKLDIINKYIQENDIEKCYVFGDHLKLQCEQYKFSDTDMYKYYYKLLQEIDGASLIIINELMRTQNRYDLKYNCVRKYCLNTKHVLVFSYFPIRKAKEDVMILYDFIQDNPFHKEAYSDAVFNNFVLGDCVLDINKKDVEFGPDVLEKYETEKQKAIKAVNKKPDIIPMRLLKFSQKHKINFDPMDKIKPNMNIMVSNLKVDQYYYSELLNFKKELENGKEDIQKQKRS